jgi:hypothetical protein
MAKVDKEHAKAELNAWIRERMPGNVSENDKVFGMFKFCLASFIYDKNSGWMESNTHSSNAIRSLIPTVSVSPTLGPQQKTLLKSPASLLTPFTWRKSKHFGWRLQSC